MSRSQRIRYLLVGPSKNWLLRQGQPVISVREDEEEDEDAVLFGVCVIICVMVDTREEFFSSVFY